MAIDDKRFVFKIEPRGLQCVAFDTLTLLEAAMLAKVSLPSSCRNGTCRTCMCRMVSGRIRYAIEWPGLSADEKKEGFVLPCVAYPESDIVIDAPDAALIASS